MLIFKSDDKKRMKIKNFCKTIAIVAIVLIIIFSLLLTSCGNYQIIDMVYQYDYAYILLPNGEIVEGSIDFWSDYEDGDQIQVCIDGIIYLTDTTRCVLISK